MWVWVCVSGGACVWLAFGLRSAYAVHCAVTIEPDVIMKSLVQYLCRWTAHAAAGDLLAPSDTTYSHAKAINSNSAAADREPRHSVCSRWLRSKPWQSLNALFWLCKECSESRNLQTSFMTCMTAPGDIGGDIVTCYGYAHRLVKSYS